MTLAAVLFAIAALGGIALAGIRLSGRELPPMWLAIVHGIVAAAALVSLLAAVAGGGASTTAKAAAAGFVLAALGGFVLFASHLRGRALPVPLVVVHGLVAVLSYLALLAGLYAAK
jgi:hypothetical protein